MVRIVPALAAALAALALAACGGSQPAEPETTTAAGGETAAGQPTSEAATTEEAETESAPTDGQSGQTEAANGGGPQPVVVRLVGGEPQGGPPTIQVRRGDRVRLRVQSDTPDEIHVHGYDLEQEAAPGRPAVFSFVAEFEGIFEIEGHDAADLVATLVVEP